MNHAIARAIELLGSQSALARACGVGQPHVSYWLHWTRRLSLATAIKIEQATDGAVTRQDLRPDLPNTSLPDFKLKSPGPVPNVFVKFPTQAALARACGVAPTTVSSWRDKRAIPAARWLRILDAAKSLGIALNPADLVTESDSTSDYAESYIARNNRNVVRDGISEKKC